MNYKTMIKLQKEEILNKESETFARELKYFIDDAKELLLVEDAREKNEHLFQDRHPPFIYISEEGYREYNSRPIVFEFDKDDLSKFINDELHLMNIKVYSDKFTAEFILDLQNEKIVKVIANKHSYLSKMINYCVKNETNICDVEISAKKFKLQSKTFYIVLYARTKKSIDFEEKYLNATNFASRFFYNYKFRNSYQREAI